MESHLLVSGRVAAPTLELSSETGGRLKDLSVDETAVVQAGQLLGQVDDSEARDEVERLATAVATARSYREESLHRLALERSRLHKEQVSAQAMLDQANWKLAGVSRGARAEDLSAAQAALDETQAQLELAQSNRRRLEKLFADDIAPQKALEQAQAEEKVALSTRTRAFQHLSKLKAGATSEDLGVVRADVAAAQAQRDFAGESLPQLALLEQQIRSKDLEVERLEKELSAAQSRVSKSRLVAPVDGSISKVLRRSGEMVQPGMPILVLLLSERMWVEVSLNEEEAAHVRPDQVVTVRFPSNPSATVKGQIADLAPSLEGLPGAPGNSKFLKTRIRLHEEPDFLKPGLEAEVEGRNVLAKDALQVPRSAVFEDSGASYVVVVKQQEARKVSVTVGVTTSVKAQILEGLAIEDMVVVNSPEELRDGERVRVWE